MERRRRRFVVKKKKKRRPRYPPVVPSTRDYTGDSNGWIEITILFRFSNDSCTLLIFLLLGRTPRYHCPLTLYRGFIRNSSSGTSLENLSPVLDAEGLLGIRGKGIRMFLVDILSDLFIKDFYIFSCSNETRFVIERGRIKVIAFKRFVQCFEGKFFTSGKDFAFR